MRLSAIILRERERERYASKIEIYFARKDDVDDQKSTRVHRLCTPVTPAVCATSLFLVSVTIRLSLPYLAGQWTVRYRRRPTIDNTDNNEG